jgi:hypothetical protein
MKKGQNKLQLPPGHKRPMTRRDFVGLGLIQATNTLVLPSLLTSILNPQSALAETGCTNRALSPNFLPMIIFDCAGGASLSTNFVMGQAGGPEDFLPDYLHMGVPGSTSPSTLPLNREFGLPLWAGNYVHPDFPATPFPVSGILTGLLESTTTATRQVTSMGSIPSKCNDDTSKNLFNPIHILLQAGVSGSYLHALGSISTLSGGFSEPAMGLANLKAVPVTSQEGLTNIFGFGNTLASLPTTRKEALRKLVMGLNSSQVKKLANQGYSQQFATLLECGGQQNATYTAPVPQTNAPQDPRVLQAFQTFQLTQYGYMAVPIPNVAYYEISSAAAIAYNVLMGNAAAGTIMIPGCDYHSPSTTEFAQDRDRHIGRVVGSVLELARLMNKPLFFAIISDGANASSKATRNWVSDDGQKGVAILGITDPRTPGVRPPTQRVQVGSFAYDTSAGNSSAKAGYLADNPELVGKAIALNYFNATDARAKFRAIVPDSGFEPTQEEPSIIFNPLPKL